MSETKRKFYERLVNLHHEVNVLNQDLKALKEEFEEALPDEKFPDLNRVAKLDATNKLGDAVYKAELFIETAEEMKG